MNERINTIKNKIGLLKKLDKNYSLFGSEKHRYKINPTISIEEIREFENQYKVLLPNEYVEFLTIIGNGGVGPFYGLEPIQNSLYDDLDYKIKDSLLNPGKPFLHTASWNLEFQPSVDEDENEAEFENQRIEFEEKYFDKKQMEGVLAICNYGCAISLNLVVNGQEYGNIWTDDRASDNGIYPSIELGNKEKITFLNWYELWLDNSIREIKAKFPEQKTEVEITQEIEKTKKPWWKIW
jgi:hypothetical protein